MLCPDCREGGQGDGEREPQPADPSGAQPWPTWVLGGLRGPHASRALSAHLSGAQVLLSLSDEDLELGLGVCSSLHRRKLRLAIEDYRDAEAGRR